MSCTFGTLVRRLRSDLRLTQDDLAALMGLSEGGGRVQIAQWESDARPFPPERLPKLAVCLGYWPTNDPTLRREVMELALTTAVVSGRNATQPQADDV